MSHTFKAWQRIDGNHPYSYAYGITLKVTPAGALSTTSSSYADITGMSLSFTKTYAVTKLRMELGLPAYCLTSSSAMTMAIQVNGVDYEIGNRLFSDLANRDWVTGVRLDAAGLAANTYTIKGRWKRLSGTGTIGLDTSSRMYMAVQEVRE